MKVIIIHLDGTLLNSQKIISDLDLKILKQCRDTGIKMCICSGRHIDDILPYSEMIGIDTGEYIISCDGCYIHNHKGNVLWKSEFLNAVDLKKIAKLSDKKRFSFFDKKNDYLYTGNIYYFLKGIVSKIIKQEKINIVRLISDNVIDVEKVVVRNCNNINDLSNIYTVHKLNDGAIEILNKQTNKYTAIKKIIEYLELDENEVIYFGDDMNDYECFCNLSNCIAMGNAINILKEHACYITDNNDNSGVGKAIKHFNII